MNSLFVGICVGMLAIVADGDNEETKSAKSPPIESNVSNMQASDELADWLTLVRRAKYRLLRATRQEGYLIAVFKSHNGNLVFCSKALRGNPSVSRFDVTTVDDNCIIDQSKVEVLTRTYKSMSGGSLITGSIIDGRTYVLTKQPASLRVIFRVSKECTTEAVNIGPVTPTIVVFDNCIDWADE